MRNDRSLLTALAVLTGLLVVSAFGMGGMMGGGMGPGMMYGYGTQGFYGLGGWAPGIAMGLGVLMMVAFWGVIMLGIAFLVRGFGGRPASESRAEPDAMAILQRRYAAGEIDEPTYRRMRGDILGTTEEPTDLRRAS
jgi:uncharacterized membrane protein